MCPSSWALGLGARASAVVNCSSMGLRPAVPAFACDRMTPAHSQPFHHFKYSNQAQFSQFSQLGFDNPSLRRVVEFSPFRSKLRPSSVLLCRATNKREYSLERSDKANEELLMFFFQIDLTTRLQRALNQDLYEAAQGLREKIAEVEREMARQRREKMTGRGGGSSSEQDTAIILLQTKAKLQRLIAEEDYEAAGKVRKKIMALEAESLAAQANTMIFQQRSFGFRLGQKVRHRVHGYRGVVCGMDVLCCESEEWAKAVGVEKLPRARNQPFYQVLVDIREEPSVMVTYVAEDNLAAPEEPDFEQFDHPYVYFLFYGMDGAGDFIACKQLREKYDAPRHELPYDKEGD